VTLLKLVHSERKQEIQILLGDVVFFVDGQAHRFADLRQSALAVAVARVSPRCFTFDEFKAVLIEEGRHGIREERVNFGFLR
jgi:hypothetical protein